MTAPMELHAETGDRRPLYLHSERTLWIGGTGNVLEVREECSAARLFPLSRLAWIECNGTSWWSAQAIAACGQAGVPILFLHCSSQESHIEAATLPVWFAGRPWNDQIRLAMEDPSFAEHYQNWHRAEQRRGLIAVARSIGVWLADFRPPAAEAALQQTLEQRINAIDLALLKREFSHMQYGHLLRTIGDFGLDLEMLSRLPEVGVLRDLYALCAYRALKIAACCVESGAWHASAGQRKRLASYYQSTIGEHHAWSEAVARRMLLALAGRSTGQAGRNRRTKS